MNKKLLALAVVSAFSAPVAMADSSNVVIGGQMHFSIDSLDGCTGGSTTTCAQNDRNSNVSSNASNIYFKGTEDLGNGLSAVWQIQTYFSAGGTGNNDTFFGAADGVSSGNTFVGLESKSWGRLVVGKHESPFKLLSRKVDLFNNQIGDTRNLTARAGTTAISTTAIAGSTGSVGWDLRPNNVIAYNTPSFNGFQVWGAYIANLGSGAAAESGNGLGSVDAWTVTGMYENGPIFVGLGYEQHNLSKYATGVSGLDDENAWRVAGGYNFGAFKVTAFYQKEDNLYASSTNTSEDRTTWGLGGAYKFGNNTIKAQYYTTDDVNNGGANTDNGADLWSIGYDYSLSKRTTLYAVYAETNNDTAGRYSAFGGGHGDNPGTATGKDPNGISLGVIHNF